MVAALERNLQVYIPPFLTSFPFFFGHSFTALCSLVDFLSGGAELILDQGYTQEKAAKLMGVGKSTVSKWAAQPRTER